MLEIWNLLYSENTLSVFEIWNLDRIIVFKARITQLFFFSF